MPIIFENVSYDYMPGSKLSHRALDHVSLTIGEGEFIAVIGKTGSGKSTLIQHVNGLLLPTEGNVTVDGMNTKNKSDLKQIRSKVGMVFQYPEYQLFEETVEKDVSFGPENIGMDTDKIAENVRSSLEMVGLDPKHFLPLSPFDLSGGEKRRVALAGILSMRPKYLALDEPMAGLDPSGRTEILNLLNRLREETGCTIIMISHSMDDIARYAEHVLVFDEGKLVRSGNCKEIFSDVDSMHSIGLSVPQATTLAKMLKEHGLPISDDVVTMQELLRDLLKGVARGK